MEQHTHTGTYKKKDSSRRNSINLKQKLKLDLAKVQIAELLSPRKEEMKEEQHSFQPNYEEIGQSVVQEYRNEINESMASIIQQQEDLFVTRRENEPSDNHKNLGNETFLGVENQSIIGSIIDQSIAYEEDRRLHRESVQTTATAKFQSNDHNHESTIKDTIERIFT